MKSLSTKLDNLYNPVGIFTNSDAGFLLNKTGDKTDILAFSKNEDEAVKLLVYLCFSDYFSNIYSILLEKYPGIDAKFNNIVIEMAKEQQENEAATKDDQEETDEKPLVSPFVLGNKQ